jgi:transcriptional regulator
MYIPSNNRLEDWDAIAEFVASVRSADLVTLNFEGTPIATLMPLVWKELDPAKNNFGTIVMHMARGNEQWKSIQAGTVGLAIVHGAQAYISPSNYSNKHTDHKVVPTWNYQSIHLTGTVEISEDVELLREIVTELSHFHESTREEPWLVEDSDPHYFELQLKGIVAVILHVEKVEAKSKLSQNKSYEERERIVEDLFQSGIPGEEVIAAKMQKHLEN